VVSAQGTGSQPALRRANEQRVLEALRTLGDASQADLARQTGLSAASINNITRGLLTRGQVQVTESTDHRETRLRLAPPRGQYLTLEISPESAYAAVFDFDRKKRFDAALDLEHQGFERDVEGIRLMVDRIQRQAGVTGVAHAVVGVRSAVDARSGQMSPSVTFRGWRDVPVAATLSAALGMQVTIDNDANLRALAEGTWGVARGVRDFLYIKTSPGVSAGIMMQGKIQRGSNGMAGEIGHMVVDRNGPLCDCGNRGCLHALASARMLVIQARSLDNEIRSIGDILARARAGDGVCARLLSEAGGYIGLAIANVVALMGMSCFVVGGRLLEAGDLFLRPLEQSVDTQTLRPAGSPLEIRAGLSRPDLCLIGGLCQAIAADGAYLDDIPAWCRQPPR
jgi:predicted NBD/HSP70 family sugar kinase